MTEQGKLVLVRRGQAPPAASRATVHRNAALAIKNRQIKGRPLRKVFDAIPKRLMVPLEGIIDRAREILRGCILLGFTKDGNHLISYSCATDESLQGDSSQRHHYRVQFWNFSAVQPLVKSAEISLFGSHRDGIPTWGSQVKLTIFETPDERLFVAHCTVPPSGPEENGLLDNYISVFESPLAHRQHSILCTSFSYLGANPAPPFNPTLAFFHPNVLVLHTGSDANSTEDLSCAPLAWSKEPLCKLPAAAELQCPAAWLLEDSALIEKEPSEVEERMRASPSLFSSLALEAERAFDVEAYLGLLRKTDLRFARHHIVDYELSISVRDKSVTALLTVTIRPEASAMGQTSLCYWLNIAPLTGNVNVASSIALSTKSANEATRYCVQLVQSKLTQPCAYRHSMIVWTNKNVLQSGKSMVVLLHPFEPVAIVKQTGN